MNIFSAFHLSRLPRCYLAAGLILISHTSASAATTMYRWIDDKGVVHFSERPPANVEAEKIRSITPVGNSPVQPPRDEQNDEENTSTSNQAAPPPVDRERCTKARENLETLNSFARIRVKGDDGELRYMTSKEISDKKRELQEILSSEC
ncbi:DUF4124 domain-containing protein [Marinibactrum halimedae]|uniref:DUF4124 domain-containing protein n=1 Tax=Marinibactrum halimedae TaxID=1444977 RepID=A0AA37WL06_9GAMM|nr:DUF4124 domain-containing protein [Marinibactrum halimedae]MCD9458825.1 DUF4124 domain-containing protein [Marinibactrum halimedae]GLS25384.1 hypothetical protein GCM10007877_10980 [Marinibactrum halimedae]